MKFTVGLCSALLLGVFIWIFQLTTVAQETSGFAEELAVSEVACTLTNGDESTCYEIESASLPEFEIGPFCPETLDDVGGIWEWDGDNAGLYALDEAFFLMVAEQGYVFYDNEGNINIQTEVGTQRGGGAPADNTGNNSAGQNNCLAQTPDEEVTTTARIPIEPVMADEITELGTVSQVGIGIDGVPIFADAPSVLDTGGLPALDVCGGHVDPGGWYHWHATASDIDSSFDYEGVEDVHCHLDQSASALFGYAFDGFPIYGSAEVDGHLAEDLDECNGHFGTTPDSTEDVYHYHATLDFPNLPTCLVGVFAEGNFSTTAQSGIGAGGQGGDRPDGQGQQGQPDLASAASQLGVTEQALRDALGTPPPDLNAAAQELGVTVEALQNALGTP